MRMWHDRSGKLLTRLAFTFSGALIALAAASIAAPAPKPGIAASQNLPPTSPVSSSTAAVMAVAPAPEEDNPPPAPPSGVHLVMPPADGQWTTSSGDLAGTRYSPLDQINTSNVANLKVANTLSDGIPHGHEGQPLVVGDTMYVVTPFPDDLIAIDLTSPNAPLRWKYTPHPDPRAVGVACCDIVNRGASYADGKIIYNLLDDETVAVDAKTGKQVWRTKLGSVGLGETMPDAPLVVHDKVIVSNSGAELGVRGWVAALDVHTGKLLWRAYSTGPDKDALIGPNFHPYYAKDQGKDLGVKTWTPDQWKIGGGTVWGYITYDPELNLIFYGTANPGVWNPDQRPGENKWSCTIFARDPDTGEARWAFQVSPHDEWDYDSVMENIAVDMPWKGTMRKLLLHPGRTGFVYVLDRATGELLSAKPFVPLNWAYGYDLKTGKVRLNPEKETHQGRITRDICPSSTGGKDFIPSAFSPLTGMLYIPAHNTCMDYGGLQASYIAGTPYLGASVKMYPGPGGYQGSLIGWDIANERPVWQLKDKILPVYCGVLATAGGLVFYGTMEGWFRAVDAHTGKILWQFKTGSGIVGNPITFVGPDHKQYIAVYSGIGGWMGATAFPDISTSDPYAGLGVVGAMGAVKELSGPGSQLYVFGL